MPQKELITMTKKESERLNIINSLINGIIDGTEASKQMGVSTRQVRRLKQRVIKLGPRGIIHQSRGGKGNRSYSKEFLDKIKSILKTEYYYFTPTMAQEHLLTEHGMKLSIEKVRQLMIKEELWEPKKRRKKEDHRSQRERKDNFGEMQQFDGCYDKWIYGKDEEQYLLASIDNATGKITRAQFEKNEGVIAVFKFWKGYIEKNGKPLSIYLDRFSTYKVNHKNAEDNKDLITQFERAMKELNIETIKANSPQAKGRIERLWRTLQKRLMIEMRYHNIETVDEANIFLQDRFIPWFNKKFAVVPKKKSNLHKGNNIDLDEVFSIKKKRVVGNDYVIRYETKYYQLEEVQPVTIFKKDKVTIETRINGEIKIKHKGKYLNFFVLKEKPKREIETMVPALTRTKSGWKPPKNHPWRNRKIKEEIISK